MGNDCRKEWSHGNNHTYIGSHRICQGYIFQQIVQTDSAEACRRKDQFLLPCGSFQPMRIDGAQGKQSHNKAKEQNLHRLEIHKQYLC